MRKLSTKVFHVEHVSVMSNQTGDVDGLASALRTLAEDFRGTTLGYLAINRGLRARDPRKFGGVRAAGGAPKPVSEGNAMLWAGSR